MGVQSGTPRRLPILRYTALAVAILALFCSTLALGQTSQGGISGVVHDASGAVIPNANVVLTNEATAEKRAATTSAEGVFAFTLLDPGTYTITIDAAGFKSATYRELKVDASRTYSLTAQLQVGAKSEVVEVVGGIELVNTTTSDVSNTVLQKQMQDLPLNGRNPIELVRLQAGVAWNARNATTINGGRPTWTSISQDGININDNYIRTNALDFVPNRPTTDTVNEFTVVANGEGADAFGGASQVRISTPSGGNTFHGSLYEFNRNSFLGANSWGNKIVDKKPGDPTRDKDGFIKRPFLNRNQFGGRASGPIIKNRLFFYGYYEGYREASTPSSTITIPRNADLLTGVFRYKRTDTGAIQTVNVLNPGGTIAPLTVDATVQKLLLANFPDAANGNVDNGDLNTIQYRFNQSRSNRRNQWGYHIDYTATDKHSFDFIMTRFKEEIGRTDYDIFDKKPGITQPGIARFYVGAWRWTISNRWQNEFRAGVNDTDANFENTSDYGGVLFAGFPLGLTEPRNTMGNGADLFSAGNLMSQGRATTTWQFTETQSFVTGNHAMKWGASNQRVRVKPFDFRGALPYVTFGFSTPAASGGPVPDNMVLTTAQFPSAPTGTNNLANALRAFLGGVYTTVSDRYNVKDQKSGYVAGYPNKRSYALDNYNIFFQDTWRFRPNLTFNLGMKWEHYSPLREQNNLAVRPNIGSDVVSTLLDPNAVIDFVRGNYWKSDWMNFSPSLGVAWDPFGDGKTSVRAGYTLAQVNEETLRFGQGNLNNNSGLITDAQSFSLYGTVAGGYTLPPATFKMPRTLADQLGVSNTALLGMIDPNLKQPIVHQFNFGITREVGWNTAVEVRYVGTLGRRLNRQYNVNQMNLFKTSQGQAFVDDFNRARANYFNCAGVLNATTATCAAAQPLQLLNTANFGGLTSTTVITAVQNRAIYDLVNYYIASSSSATVRANARNLFLPNPGIYEALYGTNGATTDYHALQMEVRRRFSNGLALQANYAFSKNLSDSLGTDQTRTEVFLDNNRKYLDRARAEFDIRHTINTNFSYELPFGKGKWLLSNGHPVVDRVVGGWQLSHIIRWQSGYPVSIISGRGTINRNGRAGQMTAYSNLSVDQIKNLLGVHKVGSIVYYINPSVLNPTAGQFKNSAVGAESLTGSAAFNGQVFFNPDPLQVGNIPLRVFDSPGQFGWNASVLKKTPITERVNTEFRVDFFNFLNHSSYYVSRDQSINSTSFMQMGDPVGPRIIQLGLRVSF